MSRIFTIIEANQLIPQLEEHLASVKSSKAILIKTRAEIKKASSKAQLGGGSLAGPAYVCALESISSNLQEVQEMGVQVKDLDLGLCDFPCLLEGRVVLLCWRIGEPEIKWWHEVDAGFKARQPLESEGA